MTRKRVAILISGRGSNMSALIEAAKAQDYPAEIALVLSNRPDAAGLGRAAAAGKKTVVVDHTPYGKDREAFDRAVAAVLDAHRIELICLAGFMRLLSPTMVTRWEGRMLNIHPALLPSFKGLHTHAQALAAGAKIHGATVHFVVPEMDSGPIIAQRRSRSPRPTRWKRWRRGCSRSSTGFIRWRSSSSRKDGCTSWTGDV